MLSQFRVRRFRALGVALLLSATLAIPGFGGKVKTAIGKDVDLASYKTYQWLPVKVLTKTGLVEDEPEVTPAVRAAVNRELAARGLRNREIANTLGISLRTVEGHFTSILSKLGVRSRTAAVVYAAVHRWFDLGVQEKEGR